MTTTLDRFTILPSEVLDSILVLLTRRDLCSVNLASQRLRAHSERFLYSEIRISWQNNDSINIRALLRTLISRPELRHSVQAICFSVNHYKRPEVAIKTPKKVDKIELDPERIAEITKWTAAFEPAKWVFDLKRAEAREFQVALFLSMVPNLKSLELGKVLRHDTHTVSMMLQTALFQPDGLDNGLHKFLNLQRISIESAVSETAPLFLHMPAVAHLSMDFRGSATFEWPTDPPVSSPLVSAEIYNLNERYLESILTPCSSLKKLKWTRKRPTRDTFQIKLDRIDSGLSLIRNKIEILTLEVGIRRRNMAPSSIPRVHGSLDSLCNMEQLKILSVSWILIMGDGPSQNRKIADFIPRRLRVIELMGLTESQILGWKPESIFSAIKSFVEEDMGMLEKLSVINLRDDLGEKERIQMSLLNPPTQITMRMEQPDGVRGNGVRGNGVRGNGVRGKEVIMLEPKNRRESRSQYES